MSELLGDEDPTPTPQDTGERRKVTEEDKRMRRQADLLMARLEKGVQRNRTVSVATISALVAFVVGVVTSTVVVLDKMEAVAIRVMSPTKQDLADHIQATKEAMAPDGVMGQKMAHIEGVLSFLVDGMGALCAADPKAQCPKPGRLISTANGRGTP